MDTPAEHRSAARRLLAALPDPLPRQEPKVADAVARALWDAHLLTAGPLTSVNAFVASRDGFTSLAHLLDESTGGHGAGRLLLLVTADRENFAPYPRPSREEARVRDACGALLTFLQWHCDDPDHVLGTAMRFHAEQAACAAVTVTRGTGDGTAVVHLTVRAWEPNVLAVCGARLDERIEAAGGSGLAECGGCFGRTPLVPAPVLSGPEHDAWTTFLNAAQREQK
ncbi:hypothetical protein ACWEQL_00600 [Kitasatospora sp. NPDC004240]